jgi:hypothetical protein
MKRTEDNRTADETYRDRIETARAQLALIGAQLTAHSQRQSGDLRNWGYAGDLGAVNESLASVLESLGATVQR